MAHNIAKIIAAEKQAQELITFSKQKRTSKLRQAREAAEDELLGFKQEQEAVFNKQLSAVLVSDCVAVENATQKDLAQVEADYQANKEKAIGHILNKVLDVPLNLTQTQVQALQAGSVENASVAKAVDKTAPVKAVDNRAAEAAAAKVAAEKAAAERAAQEKAAADAAAARAAAQKAADEAQAQRAAQQKAAEDAQKAAAAAAAAAPAPAPAPQAAAPAVTMYEVIGGGDKGGIIVREGKDTSSKEKEERLATGAIIQEVESAGDRVSYKVVNGSGPQTGWISKKVGEKAMIQKIEK